MLCVPLGVCAYTDICVFQSHRSCGGQRKTSTSWGLLTEIRLSDLVVNCSADSTLYLFIVFEMRIYFLPKWHSYLHLIQEHFILFFYFSLKYIIYFVWKPLRFADRNMKYAHQKCCFSWIPALLRHGFLEAIDFLWYLRNHRYLAWDFAFWPEKESY